MFTFFSFWLGLANQPLNFGLLLLRHIVFLRTLHFCLFWGKHLYPKVCIDPGTTLGFRYRSRQLKYKASLAFHGFSEFVFCLYIPIINSCSDLIRPLPPQGHAPPPVLEGPRPHVGRRPWPSRCRRLPTPRPRRRPPAPRRQRCPHSAGGPPELWSQAQRNSASLFLERWKE